MKILSQRVSSTPLLQQVRQNWGLDKGCWECDLNATIKQIHENKSPYTLPCNDSSSISLAEHTVADKLLLESIDSHETQSLLLQSSSSLPLINSPSFSLSETTTTDKLSPDFFSSQIAKEMFPPGMVFDPSDEVLVSHYLKGKVSGCSYGGGFQYIKDIQLYEHEPGELSSLAYDSGHRKCTSPDGS